MNVRQLVGCVVSTVALSSYGWSQGALFDRIGVELPNNVRVNDKVLPAGHYEIRQLHASGNAARILFVDSDQGTHFEVSGATIPILSNETPWETKVILQHIGQNYYLNQIWVSGKDYGYEFPLPSEAKRLMQERAEPVTLSATYEPPPVQVARAAPPPPQPAPPPAAAPPPPPAPEPEPAPPPAAAAPPQPEPAPPPAAAPQNPEPTPPPAANAPQQNTPPPAANPPQQNNAPALPNTADNWAEWVGLGVLLAAFGALLLRRKTA